MPIQKVTSGIIADGAIVATDIADGTVTGPKLGANSVSSNNIIASVTLTTPRISGNLNLDTAGTTGIRVPAANTIAIHTAGAEDMRIDANGNIGIGTSTITSGAGWSPRLVLGGTDTALIFKGSSEQENSFGASGGFYIDSLGHSSALNNIIFRNTNVNSSYSALERMRITNGGGVRFACENFANQPSSTNFGVEINNTNSGSTFFGQGTGTESHLIFGNRNGVRGSIQTTSGGTSYNTTSDYRLKENIAPMTGALAKISQLNPVTYNWKIGGNGQGFIAHELQEVVPEAVTGEKDAIDENGEPKYQMVDTSFLVATLTAAIQELKTELDDAKQRITELENANK